MKAAELLALCALLSSVNGYDSVAMWSKCRQSSPAPPGQVEVQDAIRLQGAYDFTGGYSAGVCTVTLRASLGRRLIINFESLDMFSSDDLELYDSQSAGILSKIGSTLHGYDSDSDARYRTSGRYLTIKFRSSLGDRHSEGFQAVVTPFHSGSCDSSEFQCCSSRDCIDADLRNDLYDNCLDSSDEWDATSCMTAGAIAGVTVGVLFVVIVMITVIVVLVVRRNKRLRRSQGPLAAPVVTQTVTSGASMTSYPQQTPNVYYPHQGTAYLQQGAPYPQQGVPYPAGTPNAVPAASYGAPPPYSSPQI